MTVYVTQYSLQVGVIQVYDAEFCETSPNMVAVGSGFDRHYFHGERKNWHRYKASAEARFEKMRTTKIKSLQQQIKKLETLTLKYGTL